MLAQANHPSILIVVVTTTTSHTNYCT